MPHIKVTSSTAIPEEKGVAIKSRLGQDASIIGKSENWLMVELCENARLFFKGSDEAAAIADVGVYGTPDAAQCDKMTAAITALLSSELGVPSDRIFVRYAEYKYWGWNGANF